MTQTRSLTTQNLEIKNIADAARDDAAFEAFLVFKKGDYSIDGEEVPVGSEFTAHPEAWVKVWRKYDGERLTERRVYRIAKGEHAPAREDLDDWPGTENWPVDNDGKAYDPWAMLFLLPLENPKTGEVVIFNTRSVGGRRAVADLCGTWAKRCKKIPNCGQPKIQLDVTDMPSKKWGLVPRPLFKVIGWDEPRDVDVAQPAATSNDEFRDEIPF